VSKVLALAHSLFLATAPSAGTGSGSGPLPNITPSSNLPGTNTLLSLVAGVFEVALIFCLAGLVTGALWWAVSAKGANLRGSHTGRDIVVGSVIGAILCGGANIIIGWAFSVGTGLH
jgi:hypothetical protein